LSFGATQDAYTENGTTRNVRSIRVESSERKRIAYIQFDVVGIASATNAILKLTESDDESSGTMTIRLYAALSNNWSEDTITGSNAPGKGPLLDTFTGDIPDGKEVSFDASAFITGPGTYTLILEADPSSRDVAFAASENSAISARPELEVASGGTPPPNAAPIVSAGADQSATLSGSSVQVQLNGSASDDGLPSGSSLSVSWSQVGGPAAVSFSSSNSPSTQATFTQAGSYTLRLTASDGTLTSTDEAVVTINPPAPTNQAPVVNAGPDLTATLSGGQATTALDGSATDDGLPSGSSLAVAWSRPSGPAAVTFSSPSSPDTNVTFTVAGTYVLRLSATDGSLTATDDTTVVVSDAPSSGGTQTNFLSTHDAYTENGSNRNASNLRVESSSRKRIVYLQFDLSAAVSPISSATLELTEDDDVSSGSMTLRLFAATSNSWSESTISGSNAPARGAELDSVTGDIGNDESVTFDVSTLVTAPGIYSFILEADASSNDVAFASSENATTSARPILRVTGGAAMALRAEPAPAATAEPASAVSIQRMPDQGIRVSVAGVAGRSYRIQRTSDLVHWETLKTVIAAEDGALDFIDPDPPQFQAFYRLEWDD
jgi:hypothetical protein